MRSNVAFAAWSVVAVAALGTAWWWQRGSASRTPADRQAIESAAAADAIGSAARATVDPAGESAAREAGAMGASFAPVEAVTAGSPSRAGGAPNRASSTSIVWPVARSASPPDAGAAESGDPAVAVELAFKALQYVGVDPAAERTWVRAIDDRRTPAGDRSDLIEDLNQEGFTDNSHPTKDDLPLILARLELIERLAPYAIDEVNADAFEEAYKDLLAMYLRLGGEPRGGQ